ncbi:MAG: hypothetical protein JWO57_4272 [Pseudonocardiales bacterium]|nr:hypothetical protein [Pseudonocardiales bacterium]
MTRTVVVRYETRPDAAEENQRLVEAVYEELHEQVPPGLRYATFRLEDGVTFVHVAVVDGGGDPLAAIAAFREFQRGIGDRVVNGPTAAPAALVGAYRLY